MSHGRVEEPFGAVPKRLSDALSEGELTLDEFAVLAWLELNVNYRLPEPAWHGTTRRMAEAMQWPHTPKHLGKVLRGLHTRGWIESGAQSRSPKPYALRLLRAACRRRGDGEWGVCDECGFANDDVQLGLCPDCR